MKCSDVRKLLPDLALGDLDAEPAREAAEHLKSCAECRAEEAALGRTIATLSATAPVGPSTDRREAAVAAMVRAHGELAEKLLIRRPRSRWIPVAAAAAFVIAIAAALMLRTAPSFDIVNVSGQAVLLDRGSGLWRPAKAGDHLRPGDRLMTQKGGVRLAVAEGTIHVDQNSSVDVTGPDRLTLDQGRVCVVLGIARSKPLDISDIANNTVSVREGRVEASLRDVLIMYGSTDERPGKEPFIPEPRTEIHRRMVARVGAGAADLGGTRLAAGQEGTFEFSNKTVTSALKDPAVGTWIKD